MYFDGYGIDRNIERKEDLKTEIKNKILNGNSAEKANLFWGKN